jgi:hypothetical protein
MNMQATEVKAEVEQRVPATEQPAVPVAESAPVAAQEGSCCAAQSAPARSRRWWLIGGAALALPLALYAGWDWLAATGLATVLIALGPCLAMCALGLCMRGKSKTETPLADVRKTYGIQAGEPPSRG